MNKLFSFSPRTRFAELLRAYYLGRITNWDFEEAVEALEGTREEDNLICSVFYGGPWLYYSDNRNYKFTDEKKLTRDNRKIVARWILFLKSGQSYSWPHPRPLPGWILYPLLLSGIPLACLSGNWCCLLVGLVLLGFAQTWNVRLQRKAQPLPPIDHNYWPFLDQDHFEQALRHPPYLRGPATVTS